MPRRVQDIVPSNRRTILDVPVEHQAPPTKVKTANPKKIPLAKVPETRAPERRAEDPAEKRVPVTPPPQRSEPGRRKGRKRVFALIILGVIVVIAGLGYVASAFFSRATFTLTPKTLPVTVNSTYIAQNAAPAGTLPYEIVSVRGTASTSVAAVDGPAISSKAQGKVTLYNSYSAEAQKLIAGTRLSDASGRIYRLTGTVVVPGMTTAGSSNLPGTIAAPIIADQPGSSYNISKGDPISDFRVVAYQGTPRADGFYARLASDVTGGQVGTKKIVSAALAASTTATLKEQLTATLKSQIARAVPPGSDGDEYVLYDKGVVTSFGLPDVSGTQSSRATISLQGTAYGVLFKKSDLATKIAGDKTVAGFGSYGYTAPGLDALDFSITNPKDFSPEKKNTLIIHLAGDMKLVGSIPIEDIRAKLAGMSLASTQDVLKKYSAVIEKGVGELVPPWSSVPSDPKRISIIVEDK